MRPNQIWKWGAALVFAGSTALFAAIPPGPGVINFVEGQAAIDGRPITNSSVGKTQLQTGDVLQTTNGRAEVLLSPGIFLRLSHNSELKLVSPDLLDTRVELEHGSAMVEADQLQKNARIRVEAQGSETTLLKNGLYRFSANIPSVAVYDGKAQVMENDREVVVKKGHEVNVTAPLKSQKFDVKKSEGDDSLYAWSQLRSEYMSEASAATAQTYIVDGWGGWYGPGWYWNPMWDSYAWLPGDGIFWGPFGWGYPSPFFYGGFGAGYFGGGYYGGGFYNHPFTRGYSGIRPGIGGGGHAISRGSIGGFHGGGMTAGGFHGGGFGGGGFHGGGFGGGGFHGGGFGGGGHR